MPAAENLLAVGEMAHDRLGFALVRQGLSERAVAHPGRLEHQPIQEIGEGRLRDIDHQRLGDLVAPAGIGILAPRFGDDRDRRRVGWREAVEDLREVG